MKKIAVRDFDKISGGNTLSTVVVHAQYDAQGGASVSWTGGPGSAGGGAPVNGLLANAVGTATGAVCTAATKSPVTCSLVGSSITTWLSNQKLVPNASKLYTEAMARGSVGGLLP